MKVVSKLSYYGLLTIALRASININFIEITTSFFWFSELYPCPMAPIKG